MLPGAPTLAEHEELIRLLMAAEGERLHHQYLQQQPAPARRPRPRPPTLCLTCLLPLLPIAQDLFCGCPMVHTGHRR